MIKVLEFLWTLLSVAAGVLWCLDCPEQAIWLLLLAVWLSNVINENK